MVGGSAFSLLTTLPLQHAGEVAPSKHHTQQAHTKVCLLWSMHFLVLYNLTLMSHDIGRTNMGCLPGCWGWGGRWVRFLLLDHLAVAACRRGRTLQTPNSTRAQVLAPNCCQSSSGGFDHLGFTSATLTQ